MLIPPKYRLTPAIIDLLSSIEASRSVIESIDIPREIEQNIRRASSLKSSLFSARIEGNTLTINELSGKSSRDIRKMEVFNILKAIETLSTDKKKSIHINDLKSYHKIIMENIGEVESGNFRKEVSAIFNMAGVAVYMPPPPSEVMPLADKLLDFVNSDKERFVPIRASIAHFVFEKIHPFLDGNGRVGRLVFQAVLKKGGYGMKGLLSFEEYLDNNRSDYYRALECRESDITDYLEFMLIAISKSAESAKQAVISKKDFKKEDTLLPRRAEILAIIRDHRLVSFDQIRRRFMMINERTLRYDLKRLADGGFIRKRGATKGAIYEAK